MIVALPGHFSYLFFITAYEESRQNRDSHFLIRSVLVSKGNLSDVYVRATEG